MNYNKLDKYEQICMHVAPYKQASRKQKKNNRNLS